MSIAAQNSRWVIAGTALFIVLALFANVVFTGTLGQIGPDNDDVMRLLQVRDFFQGQSWFDVTQFRLGLEGGTAMHWSRLPDIPLIILIGVFDLFLPYTTAESFAITIWPPLCFLIVFMGLVKALKGVGGRYTLMFGLVLTAFIFFRFYRFFPGAIDHHNIQMGLLAVAIGFAIDPKFRARSGVISGIACAASIAIGTEVAVFIGIICAFFAINWLTSGSKVRSFTMGFGLALAFSLCVIFFGTIAPQNYGKIYCDSLSLIMLNAGLVGGLAMAIIAYMMSSKTIVWRFACLAVLATACGVLFLTQAPQCLANPLSDLPQIVQTLWLDQVIEAQNMYDLRDEWASEIAYMMGMQITALIVTIWLLLKGENRRIFGLYLALIVAAFAFSLYQARFYIFGFLFAIVPLAYWIGGFYGRRKEHPDKAQIGYILALAVSLPYVWSIGSVFAATEKPDIPAGNAMLQTENGEDPSEKCFKPSVIETLASLPEGVVLAIPNGASKIISETPHRAIYGNYHRSAIAIKISLEIFTLPPSDAGKLLKVHNVNYLHFCRTTADTVNFAKYRPDGLFGQMMAGYIPDYLIPVSDLQDGAVTLYSVE